MTPDAEYDVFISYAVEDKIGIVNELSYKLNELGINVCTSCHRLRVDEDISKSIQEGLDRSCLGILIISPNFFAKQWPKYELRSILPEKHLQQKVMFIWHNITKKQIAKYDTLLAGSSYLNSGQGIDHLVNELVAYLERSHHIYGGLSIS